MRSGTLSEKPWLGSLLVAVLAGALSGCGGDHHVSPWGSRGPSLDVFMRPPDLASELARVEAETAALGLVRTEEITGRLPPPGSGPSLVLRGYEGRDLAGRKVHAVRVATPYGVVLAAGPLDAGDLDRTQATELVPALAVGADGAGLAYRSGTDLNGDGAADVVLRNDAGTLEIWRLSERGSGPIPVSMAAPPTRGVDADGDGMIDLWGQLATPAGDPIAPRLTDVATFAAGSYSNGTPAARAWHAREAASPLPTSVSDAVRLRAAVEHAWHAILAGEPRESVIRMLLREPVPAALRASFEVHQHTLASIRAPGPA